MTKSEKNLMGRNSPTANNPAIIFKNQSLSYTQFFDAVLTAENHLKNSGIQNHDRIGILSHNSVDYIIAIFALWRIGAITCLFSTRLPENTLNEQLKSINCQSLLTSVDLAHISEPLSNIKRKQFQFWKIFLALIIPR